MISDEFDVFRDKDIPKESSKNGKNNVMIIDDDASVRSSLALSLKDKYNIILCSSGDDGIEKVNEVIDVVILDIKMDKKDGFATFTEIKEKFPHLPIVFHSAYQNLKDPFDILNNYRPFGYIFKGSNYLELKDTISSAINYYSEIRKNQELVKELKTLNASLEEKVDERTKELKSEVAERKKAEEKFRTMAEEIADGVILLIDNSIDWANRSIANIFGYNLQEIKGVPINKLIKSEDYELLLGNMKKREKGEALRPYEEIKIKRNDGDERNLTASARVINFEDISATQLVLRDVTDRKKAEDKIRTYISQLQESKGQVEKSAKELITVNEKLTKSEKQLKELNESKDKFFSIIAHDLKSPFTSLLGFSEFLISDIKTLSANEIQEFAEYIHEASRNVFNLLENLLQWARIQTGRISFNPTKVNTTELTEEIIELYQINVKKKGIKLESELKNSTNVKADKNMTDTIIRNLVSNAIKFTSSGGKVTVDGIEDDGMVKFSVSDTGRGMSEKIMNKLFKIEEHVTLEGTEKEKGTGLGLILCKEFVEANGGRIWVESEEGKGSKFYFTLPKD